MVINTCREVFNCRLARANSRPVVSNTNLAVIICDLEVFNTVFAQINCDLEVRNRRRYHHLFRQWGWVTPHWLGWL